MRLPLLSDWPSRRFGPDAPAWGWGWGCCCESPTCTVRKLNSSGVQVWKYLATETPSRTVVIDNTNAMLYVGSGLPSTIATGTQDAIIEKLATADAAFQWDFSYKAGGSGANLVLAVSPSDDRVYYGSVVSPDLVQRARALTLDGSFAWENLTASGSYLMYAAAAGLMYWSGATNPNRRLDASTGAQVWSNLVGTRYAAIDSSGRMVGIEPTGFSMELWFYTQAAGTRSAVGTGLAMRRANGLAVDPSDVAHVSGTNTPPFITTVYFAQVRLDGTVIWENSEADSVTRPGWATFDYSGNSLFAFGTTVRKYDSAGNLLWTYNHGATVNCIVCDSSDNVYLAGDESGT